MKQILREMKLSVPFRTICFQCKKELNFDDRKYSYPGISSGHCRYYCEECTNHSEAGSFAKRN